MAVNSIKMRKSDFIEIEDFKKKEKERANRFSADKLLKLSEKHASQKGPRNLSEKHDNYLYGR